MSQLIKEYSNGEITVVWKPHLCIHSKICCNGLLEVFDPSKRPWINMDGSTTEKIIKQVGDCPTSALSCYRN